MKKLLAEKKEKAAIASICNLGGKAFFGRVPDSAPKIAPRLFFHEHETSIRPSGRTAKGG